MPDRLTVYHIPVCPFCQRLEVLLALRGRRDDVAFVPIDISRPRPDWFLAKTRGTTATPVLETREGRVLKESLVLLGYLDDVLPGPKLRRADPYERAVEAMMTALEPGFATAGYTWVLNQDPARRETLRAAMLAQYARLDTFLREHNPDGTWLFEGFGWAEAVFTPLHMRFWFLEHYEGFVLPDDPAYARVRRWVEASLAHPAAQQVTREQILKMYYDYAQGAGNGGLLPGRRVSSFTNDPPWQARPMPPGGKYGRPATDAELGLA